MDGQSDLDKYRLEWESDDQWLLRKSFIARHWGKYKSINRLICLSQIFINVEFLGCRYNQGVMDEVISLSAGLSDARRDERRKVIEKTFVRGGQLQQETSNSSGTVNSGRRNYHGRSAAAVVVDDSSNARKTKNPFVSPAPKRARESLDIQEEPKSPLLLKKEKSVIGLRAVLTVVSDPASKKLSRQPVPDSPRELLNHVCNREKVSWRLDVAERKEPVVEYFLSVNDILLVHQFCFSKEEAMNLGCTAALQCLKSVCLDTREEESNGGLLKFALYTSKDKRLGWSGPDDDLFAVLYQKFDIVSRKFANSDEKAEDAFEDFESFCKKEMIPFEIGTQQKSGPNQELFMSVAGVSVSYLNLQGKDLEPGRAGENKRKLCSDCLMALRKKFRRIYEADNGELRLISADQEVTDEFIRLALANQGKGGRETGDANVVDLSTNSKSRIPSSCAECESGGCTVFPQLISKFIIKHGFNEEISLEKAKGIFIQSAAFSGLNYEFDTYLEDSGGGYRAMNAVVVLCHFCEGHGPKVLFCCQPFQEENEEIRLTAGTPDSGKESVAAGPSSRKEIHVKQKLFYGNYDVFLAHSADRVMVQSPDENSSCESCGLGMGNLPVFLTNDHDAKISYVSSRYPYPSEVYGMVKKACLRSLSCEISSEKEGPVFFGDDEEHGYTLAHTFTLRDAEARGFQHFYSVAIVSVDKLLLLNSYDFLLKCLEKVIGALKTKANRVFETEQRALVDGVRLSTVSRANMLPSGFLRHRAGSGANSRPLSELTGDANIFRFLHRYFLWILKAQTMRIVELVLEGCPTQDTLVRMEQEEERAEQQSEELEESSPFMTVVPMEIDSVRPSFFALGSDSDATMRDEGEELFYSWNPYADLQTVARSLGPDCFRLAIYRTLVGEQTVVCGEDPEMVRRVIRALMCLIPRGCAKPIYFSCEYQEPWLCNLLGLEEGSRVASGRNVMAISLVPAGDSFSRNKMVATSGGLESLRFKVRTSASLPPSLPRLLVRMEELVWDESLGANVLEEILVATKEEWLNKTKVVFQYTRQHPCASQKDIEKLMSVVRCSSSDKEVIKFWQAGLSKQYKAYVLNTCARLHQVQRGDKA